MIDWNQVMSRTVCGGARGSADRVNAVTCLDVAPPALGEHTAEILAELGHDKEQITDWVERGVVAIDARHTRR